MVCFLKDLNQNLNLIYMSPNSEFVSDSSVCCLCLSHIFKPTGAFLEFKLSASPQLVLRQDRCQFWLSLFKVLKIKVAEIPEKYIYISLTNLFWHFWHQKYHKTTKTRKSWFVRKATMKFKLYPNIWISLVAPDPFQVGL